MTEKLIDALAKAHPQASEINISFPDRWELIHVIPPRENELPLYVAAFPLEEEGPRRDHFPGLSPQTNLSLTHYRLYRFFQPWLIPSVIVEPSPSQGSGRVIGQSDLKLYLREWGDAQAWTGQDEGVLWECYLHRHERERKDWKERLAEVWQVVEKSMGVKKIFTTDYEPTVEPEAYRDFLERMGYAPEPSSRRWWSRGVV